MSYLMATPFTADYTSHSFDQRFTKACRIKYVRVKMLKHGTISDGTFTLEVLEGERVLGSTNITAAQITSNVPATYAHGMFTFEFTECPVVNINKTTAYVQLTFRLSVSGHTFNSNSYMAVCRDENPFAGSFGSRPTFLDQTKDVWFNPIGVEIFTIS